jgi:hypothetical protein
MTALPAAVGHGNTIEIAKLARHLHESQQTIANGIARSAREAHSFFTSVPGPAQVVSHDTQTINNSKKNILDAQGSRFGGVARQLGHQEGLRQGRVRQQQLQRSRLLVLLDVAHIVGLQQTRSTCRCNLTGGRPYQHLHCSGLITGTMIGRICLRNHAAVMNLIGVCIPRGWCAAAPGWRGAPQGALLATGRTAPATAVSAPTPTRRLQLLSGANERHICMTQMAVAQTLARHFTSLLGPVKGSI